MPQRFARILLVALATFCVALPAWSREIAPGSDLRAAVKTLKPGDELVLDGGTYAIDFRFIVTANGTAGKLIVIRAKAGKHPVIAQSNRDEEIIEIRDSQYVVIRGIEFRGGSHGINLVESDFITIEDCEIHDTGDAAIAANAGGTYEGLKLLRNDIHHTAGSGEGMYLGCNRDECRLANSLIEGNHVHHTNGPDVEQGDGIEVKEGSYGNVIRDNVVHDTNAPGIITYGTVGNGPANIIERNAIWNVKDNGIQSAADAVIRNNIVLGSPIALQKHQGASPSNLQVVHNTVITKGDAIALRDVSGEVLIANNALYSSGGFAVHLVSGTASWVTSAGNVGVGGLSRMASGLAKARGLRDDFVEASSDLRPKAGSSLISAGSRNFVGADDFDGVARGGVADAGAYRYSRALKPKWIVGPTFKLKLEVARP
ncbi:MAG: right-handed parallel beta-helix repeat-containing protein [Micropepsaceae bacterium]